MDKKRIVITGVGIVSPIGIGKDAYWQGLGEGRTGFKPITLFDASQMKVKVAGEISEFDPKEILGKKGLVDLDRATTLLLSAGKFALEDAHLEISATNTHTTGIAIGATSGSLRSISEFDRQSLEEGPHFVNASRFPNTVMNSPASRAAIRFGIKGPNVTISTGFSAALDALEYAVHSLYCGRAQVMLCGAVEEFCLQTFLGFYALGYLSGMRNNHQPQSCPFDKRRDGIIFSEGAGVLVLEELSAALERGAGIYAEVLGVGSNFDPYRPHKFNPKGAGIKEAMQLSLRDARLKPADIDCVFANANSTLDADASEAKAIREVFGFEEVKVTAIKSMVGESFSASGALAISAALGSLENEFIPPTVHSAEYDPGCGLSNIVKKVQNIKVDKVMVHCFGPNGQNNALVLGKYQ